MVRQIRLFLGDLSRAYDHILCNLGFSKVARWGESATSKYLRSIGFETICRNWSVRSGELDLIAVRNRELIFVEVKTRHHRAKSGFTPADGLTEEKLAAVDALASQFISKNRPLLKRLGVKSIKVIGSYVSYRRGALGRLSVEEVRLVGVDGGLVRTGE